MEPWEYPIAAAWRELREEAGLSCLQHAKRVKVYDDPKRDPAPISSHTLISSCWQVRLIASRSRRG
ncbi:hypothetical protein HGG76_02655 [Ochrobactrum tritici]|uniref:Nudix hydrolase domain-containing protein n=1 Tax=Brucella tritici TaxID=94626 RepID=A0A7X6JBM8_9HYPH|nr:hypothetical protein [Brucella tritici]